MKHDNARLTPGKSRFIPEKVTASESLFNGPRQLKNGSAEQNVTSAANSLSSSKTATEYAETASAAAP
ncbi:hypothetical protein [Mesorhizobium sp.]|uniref:hypothetical protein n=1 Tax=Mesorhizobium sp. TaxID=1871066 RepID=UPI000FE961C2|nr:hypothetical protein [Mesorhizobium sp.]RWQ01125.1 MAG: hypothetical protein EOR89_14045 [Mesorhizobium sp.]RWQ48696.1 MAG: hypothetical protein EOS82_18030 [Mesorhizobium sp.]